MPLTKGDRVFLHTVDRFKLYLILIALGVLVFLLITPHSEIRMVTSVIGLALCGVFWLTQRLLSFISTLDLELSRVTAAVKRTLTDEQRKEFFPSSGAS